MVWTREQIINHRLACEILERIKNNAFVFIRENKEKGITEYDVQQFILEQFEKYNVENEVDKPIVAFNKNAAIPHYFPKKKSKKLEKNTLILIDIWARLRRKDTPYSDITWMGYYGDIPEDVKRVFDVVIQARDEALIFVESQLESGEVPIGAETNEIAQGIILNNGFEKNIKHSIGHSIGFKSPHGKEPHVNSKNLGVLKLNLGYTIEPGVYFDGKFGIRSEINFFINENKKLIVTTPMQKEIVRI